MASEGASTGQMRLRKDDGETVGVKKEEEQEKVVVAGGDEDEDEDEDGEEEARMRRSTPAAGSQELGCELACPCGS